MAETYIEWWQKGVNTAEVIDITQYLPVIQPIEVPEDDYSDFMEDLKQLKTSVKEIAAEIGVTPAAVYSWKRNGVPMYAHKFLDMKMQLFDAEIRLGKRKP